MDTLQPTAITAMRYTRTWTIALHYGIHQLGGIELKYFEAETLIEKIAFHQNLPSKTDTNTFSIAIDWFHHFYHILGIITLIVESPSEFPSFDNSI